MSAINTGNNLLYLLLGMLLSMIIASGVLSEMSLRGLQVRRRPPARVHVNQPFLMGIELQNGKQRLPSFSIEVEDLVSGSPIDKKCYFLKLPAGKMQQTSYRHTLLRRGLTEFSGLRLSTRFPFGLFRKSRVIDLSDEILVLPRVVPVANPPRPRGYAFGDEAHGRKGRRGEFHGLREFRDGDDPRDIHWRSSARKGRQMVREYEDEASRRVVLFLDNALAGGDVCNDEIAIAALERAVSLAASLSSDYLERGFSLKLVARGQATGWMKGPAQLLSVLRVLALLPAVEADVAYAVMPDRLHSAVLVTRRGSPHERFGQVVEV